MQVLAVRFMGRGEVARVVFTQLFRYRELCLYHRSDSNYEVMRVRYQKATTIKMGGVEVRYEEKEFYPKGEGWGKYEYCTSLMERAIELYNQSGRELGYDVWIGREELEAGLAMAGSPWVGQVDGGVDPAPGEDLRSSNCVEQMEQEQGDTAKRRGDTEPMEQERSGGELSAGLVSGEGGVGPAEDLKSGPGLGLLF